MEPQRILYIHGGILARGGTESYIMNYYRHFDRSRLQVDFIVHGFGPGVYDQEIEALGGRIYHVPVKSRAPLQNRRQIARILRENPYPLVHAHMDAMSYVPLKLARDLGVPVRIAHSHNMQHMTNNPVKIRLNEYARRRLPGVATHLFACTRAAGLWLYGPENEARMEVIPNAIEAERFAFDPAARARIRARLGFTQSDVVLGHVGRFAYQKNHAFLVEMFAGVRHSDPRCKLVLVGDGPLQEEVRRQAAALGVADALRFVPACPEVNEYYSAFDLFCLPSRFEGLGIVMIEAQASGLRCLASEPVPRAADVTGGVQFLPLDRDAWVRAVLDTPRDRLGPGAVDKVRAAGYDITVQAGRLQQRYETLLQQAPARKVLP